MSNRPVGGRCVPLGIAALVVAAGAGAAYGLSHHHSADAEVGVGDHPATLACGHPFASGPIPIYMDTTSTAQVPRHGQFTLVVTRDCKASTHVVAASGVKVMHRFQGLDFAYEVRLQRARAILTVAVNGTDRSFILIGATPAPPSPAA